jgi:hypothetical protein
MQPPPANNNPANAPQSPTTAVIAFRLDEQSMRLLSERAERLRIPVHALARTYLIALLCQSDHCPVANLECAPMTPYCYN